MLSKRLLMRLMMMGGLLIIISFLVFMMIHISPEEIARAYYGGDRLSLTPEKVAMIEERFSLNEPLLRRYGYWLQDILRGNFGYSLLYDMPVSSILKMALPQTLLLGGISIGLIVLLSLFLGTWLTFYAPAWVERVSQLISVLSFSIPMFWGSLFVMWLFAFQLGWLPSGGAPSINFVSLFQIETWKHMLLPMFVLVGAHVGFFTLLLQDSLQKESGKYYVLVMQANGLEKAVIVKSMLKNALIPYIAYWRIALPSFLSGSIIIENIFSWTGFGRVLLTAVERRDVPILMAAVLVVAVFTLSSVLASDLLLFLLYPQMRKEGYHD